MTSKPHTPLTTKLVYSTLTGVLAGTLSLMVVSQHFTPEHVDALTTQHADVAGETMPPVPDEAELILLAGVDDRSGTGGRFGDPKEITGSRADAIMLVAVPKDQRHVVGISIPRDATVERGLCNQWDDSTNTVGDRPLPVAHGVRINSTLADGGPQCLVSTVRKLVNANITRYVQVGFQAFEDVVDAIGGVDMCFEEPVVDETLGVVIPTPGEHHIDGRKALDLARVRKVVGTPMSDFDRSHRQQQLLGALFHAAKHKFTNPTALLAAARSAVDDVQGDRVSPIELLQLLGKTHNIPADRITLTTAPILDDGHGNPDGDVVLDVEQLRHVVADAIHEPKTLADESEKMVKVPERGLQRVVVRGAAGDVSADRVAQQLRDQGWEVTQMKNYSGSDTFVGFGSRSAGAAIQVSSDLWNTRLVASESDVQLRDLLDAGPVVHVAPGFRLDGLQQKNLAGMELPYPATGATAQDYTPVDVGFSTTPPVRVDNQVCSGR